jgi:thioredoxin
VGWYLKTKLGVTLLIIAIMVILGIFGVLGAMERARMNQSTPAITHIYQGQFKSVVINSPKPVVVDIYAPWCAPCRELSPMLERVAPGFTNAVRFVKVNYDEAPDVARAYGIDGIPTLLMFRRGQLVSRLPGLPTEMALKAELGFLATGQAVPGPD